MNRKDSPQSVIDSYRRRQQMTPVYMAGLAVVLVIAGIIILVLWLKGNNGLPIAAVQATPTATITETAAVPTETLVPPTATITPTATETQTPTVTLTLTPSGPFTYKVQDGDTCCALASTFEVELDVLLAINSFEPGTCPITPGQDIYIPLKGMQLPTETPIPQDMTGKISYRVKTGESLEVIAARFNSTVDAIVKENKITKVNDITAGQELTIPVNIITATPTKAATITNTPGGPTEAPTQTPINLVQTATTEATVTSTPQQ